MGLEAIGGILGGATGGIIGAGADLYLAKRQQERSEAMQREFAQNGIRWRVEDAKAAGIHPLYALGASTASFSPVTVGSNFQQLGQEIGRSAFATRSVDERQEELMRLRVEHEGLQNDYLRAQIAKLNASPNPAFPLPSNSQMPLLTGQGDSYPSAIGPAYVEEKPLQRVHSQPGIPQQEVGSIPDYGFVRTKDGYALVPSSDVKQRIEDQMIPEFMWALRNQILPAWSGPEKPDLKYFPVPKGYDDWEWSRIKQSFVPVKRNKGQYQDGLYSKPSERR